MTEHSLWRFSRALHRAINERQPADLEALLDDDVDWAIYGPIDMFPFFGSRQGKAAVMEVIRQIAENVRVHRFDRESIMLGVDSASSMMRYSLTALDSNKPISLRHRAFRAVQGRPADQLPRAGRYRSIWSSRRSAIPSICRGWRSDVSILSVMPAGGIPTSCLHQPQDDVDGMTERARARAAPSP